MQSKYFEYIVVYLSVLVVCALIGVGVRLIVIGAGADEFTANTVFWVVASSGVIIYAVLTLLIDGLLTATIRKFFPKKTQIETSETTPLITESLEEIRAEQKRQIEDKKRVKLDYVVQYTRKEFAPYVSDEDLEMLCRYVELYADQLPLNDIQPIRVKTLTSLDLFHFGWNIWKYLNISKQDDIALFLKKVFAHKLRDIEADSIKSHLKDHENKGIIKIQKNITA
ncbi:MAG: mobilization protein [Proteiniphilum sp.]|nr:mobilization protein [Proteiniphilum sp.]MDD4415522.1 mobilization protein [Proteiniphilum sp.]